MAAAIFCIVSLPVDLPSIHLLESTPYSIAAIAQKSAKPKPPAMFFSSSKNRPLRSGRLTTLNLELFQLLCDGYIFQLHVLWQTILVRRIVLALDERCEICTTFFGDAEAVRGDEVAGHEFFHVGDLGERRNADFPFVRLV